MKTAAIYQLVFFSIISLISLTTSAQWTQVGSDIDGEAFFDNSGWSVSMPDAKTVAVGAVGNDGNGSDAGHVRVYALNGGIWLQKGNDIDGEAANDQSGYAASMPDSNTVAIGAWRNDGNGSNSGHVRIYHWNGSAWVQKGLDLDGEAANDNSGTAVSMPNTNTIAIGAPGNDGNGSNSGHVRVYSWNGSAWVLKGIDIDGEAADDQSGYAVSMPNPNTVAIGAIGNDGNGSNSGHVRIYRWNGSSWVQKGNDIDGEAANDGSGESVNMPDSITVAIGAPGNTVNGINSGHVRVYKWNGSAWVQKGIDIDGEAAGDLSGYAVSMPDSNVVAIGAELHDGNGFDAGQVRIYEWSGGAWIKKGIDIHGDSAYNYAGIVSMPNINTVAIGAPINVSAVGPAGNVRVFSFGGITTKIEEVENNSASFDIYPNPTNDNVQLKLNQQAENRLLQIFDLQGKLIHQQVVSRLTEKINTQTWKAGIYFVRLGEQMKKLVILE